MLEAITKLQIWIWNEMLYKRVQTFMKGELVFLYQDHV